MELQDALKSCDWNVTTTMEKLSTDMKAISEKQKFVPKEKKPKKVLVPVKKTFVFCPCIEALITFLR